MLRLGSSGLPKLRKKNATGPKSPPAPQPSPAPKQQQAQGQQQSNPQPPAPAPAPVTVGKNSSSRFVKLRPSANFRKLSAASNSTNRGVELLKVGEGKQPTQPPNATRPPARTFDHTVGPGARQFQPTPKPKATSPYKAKKGSPKSSSHTETHEQFSSKALTSEQSNITTRAKSQLKEQTDAQKSPDRPTPIDTCSEEQRQALETIGTLENELRKALDEIDVLRDSARMTHSTYTKRQKRDAARIKETEYSVVNLNEDLEAVVQALQETEDRVDVMRHGFEADRLESETQQSELLDEVERLEALLEREKVRRRMEKQENTATLARLADRDRQPINWDKSHDVIKNKHTRGAYADQRRGIDNRNNVKSNEDDGSTQEEEKTDTMLVVEGLKEVIVRERAEAQRVKNRLEHKIRKLQTELNNKPISLLSAASAASCPTCRSKRKDEEGGTGLQEEESKWAGPRPDGGSGGGRQRSTGVGGVNVGGVGGSGSSNIGASRAVPGWGEEKTTTMAELEDVTLRFDQENVVTAQNQQRIQNKSVVFV